MGSRVNPVELIEAVRDVVGPGDVMLHRPFIDIDDRRAAAEVDPIGYDAIEAFEVELGKITGARYVIAVSSGTAALHLALLALDARRGTVVGVPDLTFAAAAAAARYCGAHLWLGGEAVRDPADRPDISIMVDLLGTPNPAIDKGRAIPVIEDAAAALGSRRAAQGRGCGAFGDIGILSFNSNKIITTGGGGAVLTDDRALAERMRHLATTAKTPSPFFFTHTDVGYNYRLSNMAAALGLGQLKRLPTILQKKRALHEAYVAAFEGMAGVQGVYEGGRHANHWLNAIMLNDHEQQLDLMERLKAVGISSRALYTPLHRQKPYNGARLEPNAMTIADAMFATTICLPSGRHN